MLISNMHNSFSWDENKCMFFGVEVGHFTKKTPILVEMSPKHNEGMKIGQYIKCMKKNADSKYAHFIQQSRPQGKHLPLLVGDYLPFGRYLMS